jgi:hypothetical protein
MAPAARYQDQHSEQTREDALSTPGSSSSTTTLYMTSTSTLTLPAPGLSTSMRFITSIITATRTLPTSTEPTSTFDWPTATPTPGRFPIPQIQGLVPGLRQAFHLNPNSPSLSPTTSHDQALKERILRRIVSTPSPSILTLTNYTSVTTTPSPSPQRSAFPRVSPPGFLYPEKLVPKSEYSAEQKVLVQQLEGGHHSASPYQPGIMGRVDYELAYLPTGIKLLFVGTLAVLVLAVIWVVLVWLVNFPPGTWYIFKSKSGKKGGEKKEERRPIDKPSKYAPGSKRETEVDIVSSTSSSEDDSAITSALPAQPFSHIQGNGCVEGEVIEMRQRPRHHTRSYHRRQQTQLTQPAQTQRLSQTFTEHRRTSSSPAPGLRFSYTPTPTHLYPAPTPTISAPSSPTTLNIPSPPNPFLSPPKNGLLSPSSGLVKRSSTEWKRDHAAFFNPPSPSHTARSASPAPSYYSSNDDSPALYSLETVDIEALEAGTAHTRSSSSSGSKGDSPNGGGMMHRSLSWIDQGLELVDGAVDGLVARVGRWTDDDGGDEALLLPVARSGKVGGRAQ